MICCSSGHIYASQRSGLCACMLARTPPPERMICISYSARDGADVVVKRSIVTAQSMGEWGRRDPLTVCINPNQDSVQANSTRGIPGKGLGVWMGLDAWEHNGAHTIARVGEGPAARDVGGD